MDKTVAIHGESLGFRGMIRRRSANLLRWREKTALLHDANNTQQCPLRTEILGKPGQEIAATLDATRNAVASEDVQSFWLGEYEAVLALEEQLAGFEGGGVRLGAYRML